MSLQNYVDAYKENLPFAVERRVSYEIQGIEVSVTVYEYGDETTDRELAYLRMEKGLFRYECECIDRHDWEELLFPVTVEGRDALLFRKTLYGFTILDAETLTEICDCFPKKVLRGEESFIITSAATFGKYLILDGCYWGWPYQFAAYDHAQKRFVNLSNACGILAGDYPAVTDGPSLILKGDSMDDTPMEVILTEPDLDRLMIEQGTTDF